MNHLFLYIFISSLLYLVNRNFSHFISRYICLIQEDRTRISCNILFRLFFWCNFKTTIPFWLGFLNLYKSFSVLFVLFLPLSTESHNSLPWVFLNMIVFSCSLWSLWLANFKDSELSTHFSVNDNSDYFWPNIERGIWDLFYSFEQELPVQFASGFQSPVRIKFLSSAFFSRNIF